MNAPILFEPFLRPMVWGGQNLETVLHKPLKTPEAYGESWEISDHPLHCSRVASETGRGRLLRELMESDRAALLGARSSDYQCFPWLIKFLDARDWLSVQVHPNEQAVQSLWPGEGSKTEAWFVVAARPGSRIYAGLRPGTDEATLRAALAAGTVVDCLHSFAPHPGQCVFLPAGTVHAVGGGVLLAEVQQTSDATFRLFDWDRVDAQGKARTLHIREAFACIDWRSGPVEPIEATRFTAPPESGPARELQLLLNCPYFQMEYLHAREPIALAGEQRLQALIVLRGSGRWRSKQGSEALTAGQVWLLPAGLPSCWLEPDTPLGGLLCTLP